MRKLTGRRATVKASTVAIASTLLLSPLLGTAPAAAAPAPATAQLKADQLPPALVQAIARDLKMSPAQYLDRAAKAQQLRDYAHKFRSAHPEQFAGAWMTRDGKPTMAVTSLEAAHTASSAGYQTRLAPISADKLENSLDQLTQWINALPRQVSAAINSVAIDVLNSQLILTVANTPAGKLLNLPTLIANVKVILSPDGGGPVDHHPMGGDTYISAPTSLHDSALKTVDVCSFGFNSVDSHGTALNISAGHCDPNLGKGNQQAGVWVPDPRNLKSSPQAGSFVNAQLGGASGLDYSVIKLTDRAVKAGMDRPTVRGANGTTLTLTGTAEPVTGAPVCKSGQSSTFTCGYVVADRVETQLYTAEGESKTVRGFASSACTLGGDSGGAIVTGTLALGITSGSNAADAPDCKEANIDLAQYGGTASLGIPIRSILADIDAKSGGGLGSGITVRVRPNAG
ncbi:S1 family peptidase [Nocardia macrotermitis]|uniref:Alpha-lytic protease n=1 Tax=Nocardia macrotermitis TaxID=2585198 RepID=A0A7K0DEJ8_9NOCA|nr:S1 family peptidase [Nocardia macrotermitis]MQY24059.1 Alpha-lytic protease [Nocardia macrotermitis]